MTPTLATKLRSIDLTVIFGRDPLAAAAKADGVYVVQNRRWKRKGSQKAKRKQSHHRELHPNGNVCVGVPIQSVLDSYYKCKPDLNVMAYVMLLQRHTCLENQRIVAAAF